MKGPKLERHHRKRFVAVFPDGQRVPFGQKDPKRGTFIDHGDEKLKSAYIARHKVNEDWTDPRKPGTLSRYLLWEHRDLQDALDAYRKKFLINS
jgi:hypothetical protein